MSDIAERVKKIIVDKLGVDESEVTSEASFTNDLGAYTRTAKNCFTAPGIYERG